MNKFRGNSSSGVRKAPKYKTTYSSKVKLGLKQCVAAGEELFIRACKNDSRPYEQLYKYAD